MPAPMYATEEEFRAYPTGLNAVDLPAAQLARGLIAATRWLDIKTGMGPNGFGGGQAATRRFDGNGKPHMMIPECISISGVSVGTVNVDSNFWIAGPEEEWLPFNEINLYVPPGNTTSTSPYSSVFVAGTRNIAITALWGYSLTPDENVKQCVIMRTSGIIKAGRSVRTFANSQAGAGGQTDISGGSHELREANRIAMMLTRSVPL